MKIIKTEKFEKKAQEYDRCKACGKKKHWQDMGNNETCKECEEQEQEAQREGRHLRDSGQYLNYPELGG